jgi:hypothetical protein
MRPPIVGASIVGGSGDVAATLSVSAGGSGGLVATLSECEVADEPAGSSGSPDRERRRERTMTPPPNTTPTAMRTRRMTGVWSAIMSLSG